MYDKPLTSFKAKTPKEADIKALILDACSELYESNDRLIAEGASETNLTGRLTEMLRTRFDGWDVDFEYQREGSIDDRDIKTDLAGEKLKPDIVVHERGPDGTNLVAIEVKGWWNPEPRWKDEYKLRRLEAKHHYRLLYRLELGHQAPELIRVMP